MSSSFPYSSATADKWAAYWGADQGSAPQDPTARVLLMQVPKDLVASRDLFAEFLEPQDPLDASSWFCGRTWSQLSQQLQTDRNVSQEAWGDAGVSWGKIKKALQDWVRERPDMSDGYGNRRFLQSDMQSNGNNALDAIGELTAQLTALSGQPAQIAGETKNAIENFSQILWEYVECMAVELEAGEQKRNVWDVYDEFAAATPGAWEPVVTPDNLVPDLIMSDPYNSDLEGEDPGGGEPGGGEPGGGETGSGEAGFASAD